MLNKHPIKVVQSAKLLNEHVGQIVKKASKRLYMLRLLKRARADTKTLLSIYI